MVFVILLVLCHRFWLGVGIGGDYPLSATIMSEYSNKKTRGAFIAAVFAMQGFGILAGAAVSIIISAIFRHAYPRPAFQVDPIGSTPHQADYVWRIIFMFGALPAALTFYYRMKMPETARYTALVERNDKRAAIEMGRVLQVDFGDFVSTGNMNPVAQRGIYSVNILSGFGHSALLIETVQDSSLIKGFLWHWLWTVVGSTVFRCTLVLFVHCSCLFVCSCNTRVWTVFNAVCKETWSAAPGNHEYLVFAWHCILQPELVPERHLHSCGLVATGEDHECSGGGFQGQPCISIDCTLLHCPWVLVHRCLHWYNWALDNPAHGFLLHDILHAHIDLWLLPLAWSALPRQPIKVLWWKPHCFHCLVCIHFLLCQLWPKCHNIHCPCWTFPS